MRPVKQITNEMFWWHHKPRRQTKSSRWKAFDVLEFNLAILNRWCFWEKRQTLKMESPLIESNLKV